MQWVQHNCFKRWSKVSTFWKACNMRNSWECWRCTGCNQQRLATDSARIRSWSGDSENYCPRFWHRFFAWNVLWQNSFHGFCYQSRRNTVLQLLMMLGKLCEVPRCLLWRGLRHHCPIYNVSCIFFNICLYFSYFMAGCILEKKYIYFLIYTYLYIYKMTSGQWWKSRCGGMGYKN